MRAAAGRATGEGSSGMREIRHDIRRWIDGGCRVALAQVVKTWGSSPRVAGSVMAVSDDARLAGSVSGGCIEGAVAQVALDCIADGAGSLEEFHASTQRAQEVGLSCGGNIDVLVAPLDEALFAVEDALLEADREYVRASVSASNGAVAVGASFLVAFAPDAETAAERAAQAGAAPCRLVDLPGESACCAVVPPMSALCRLDDETVRAVAAHALAMPRTSACTHAEAGGAAWFLARSCAQPQLVCIGGTHVSIHLCRMAQMLGYRTVVVDPRGAFATEERFGFVDELLHEWPQQAFGHVEITPQTALCALTHDPKIDVPALARALESDAFYIGSLGRSTTQLARYEELAALGYSDGLIGRIFGPIGLDLKGKEPAEIALAIMSEITAVRYGASFRMTTMAASAERARNEAGAPAAHACDTTGRRG